MIVPTFVPTVEAQKEAGLNWDIIAHAVGHGTNTMTDLYIRWDKCDDLLESVIKQIIP